MKWTYALILSMMVALVTSCATSQPPSQSALKKRPPLSPYLNEQEYARCRAPGVHPSCTENLHYQKAKKYYPYVSKDDVRDCVKTNRFVACLDEHNEKRKVLRTKSPEEQQRSEYEELKTRYKYEWLSWTDFLTCKQTGIDKQHSDYAKACYFENNYKSIPEDVKRKHLAQQEADRLAGLAVAKEAAVRSQAEENRRNERRNTFRQTIKLGDSCWHGPVMLDRPAMLHAMVIEVKGPIVRIQYDGSTNVGVTVNLPTREEWVKRENVYPAEEYRTVKSNTTYTPNVWPQ